MRKLIEKLAYKLSGTHVKILYDKLEENPPRVGMQKGHAARLDKLVEIAEDGAFTLQERVALALLIARLRRENTKARIMKTLLEGEVAETYAAQRAETVKTYTQVALEDLKAHTIASAPYIPGETIYNRAMVDEARMKGLL